MRTYTIYKFKNIFYRVNKCVNKICTSKYKKQTIEIKTTCNRTPCGEMKNANLNSPKKKKNAFRLSRLNAPGNVITKLN